MAEDAPALAMQSALAPMTSGAPPLPQESPNVRHEREIIGKIESGIEGQRQTFEQGQAALDPIRDRLMHVLESPPAAHAHLEKVKDAPKPEDYQKYTLQFASGMALLGALAGKFTRAGGTASLDAFAGAIKGWQEGNLQAYNQAMQEWKANTEKTLQNNQVELQKYREIIENKRLTVEQMMAALNIESARFQNKVMFEATQNQNYEMAFRLTDMLERNAQSLQGSLNFFGRSMEEAKQTVKSQVDALQKYPQLMDRMKPDEYLRLKGAAETFGLQLPPPPANMGGSQVRSGIGGYMQTWRAAHPGASPEEELQAQERYVAGIKASRDFATGKQGQQLGSLSTAVSHLETLRGLGVALKNRDSQTFNRIAQSWAEQTGNPAPTNFDTAKQIIGSEVVKSIVAGGGGVREREEARDAFARVRSPEQLDGAIDTAERLMAGQMNTLRTQYRSLTGMEDFEERVSPEARTVLSKFGAPTPGGSQSDGWGEVKVH